MSIRTKYSNPVASEIQIDSEHCRAICDEIGERFRGIFGREASEVPLHLKLLINQLADQDHMAPLDRTFNREICFLGGPCLIVVTKLTASGPPRSQTDPLELPVKFGG